MDKVVNAIIEAKYDRCLARVVRQLRRIKSDAWRWEGEPERNVWDHWKREMQEDQSLLYDMLEDMIALMVRHVVDGLPHEDGELMTLATDAVDDLDEELSEPMFDPDAVAAELMQRVNNLACNEPHRKEVQRLLDDQARDRYEQDMEPYRK
jgi:hypothetical protein